MPELINVTLTPVTTLDMQISEYMYLYVQVVDMRWGVPEQASDNHSTTELCIQEIKKCQQVSVGPNFVVRILISTNHKKDFALSW